MTGTMDAGQVLDRLRADEIEYLWVIYHDYHGRAGAKVVPSEEFENAVRNGVVFAMANLNFDLLDHQPANAELLADSGDFLAVPDPRSYAVMPQYPRTARMHTWIRQTDGSPWEGCPRTRLDEVVGELAREGYSTSVALEPEFYVLTRDTDGEHRPTNESRMFTQAGLAVENELIQRIFRYMRGMGVSVSQLGKEYGPGQYEMTTPHGPPIQAIDDYFTLKDAVRDAARELGYSVTFMPKPYAEWAGCSLHTHISIWDTDGAEDLTASTEDEISLSDLGNWFMGGILHHANALTGLGSPTANSYKRLLPGSWAPANTYWGYGNRSAVVRIPGVGGRRHIEHRSGDNSCQPYMFLTGLLVAGLDGIRRKIDPGPPFQGDIGHMTAAEIEEQSIGFLPRSLPEAFEALEADDLLIEGVGREAIKHFLIVKKHEFAAYQLHVHPWERTTYLEII